MKIEDIIIVGGLSLASLVLLSKVAEAMTPEKDILIITGGDRIATPEQIDKLSTLIKSEGNYRQVYRAEIDSTHYGGNNFILTGVELVRYIIKFLSTSNPNVNIGGIIIISNGKETGSIPAAQIDGFTPNASADMIYGCFDDSFEYHANENRYHLKVGKRPIFSAWVSRISTYGQQKQNGISDKDIIDQYLIKRTNYKSDKTIKWWNSWRDSTSCYTEFDKAGYTMTDIEIAKESDLQYNYNMTNEMLSSDYGIISVVSEGTWQSVDHFSYKDVNDTIIGGHGIMMFVGACGVGMWNLPPDVSPNTTLALNILTSNTLQIPLVVGFTDLGGTDICLAPGRANIGWGFIEYAGIKSFPECLATNKTFGDAYLEWLNSAVQYQQTIYYNPEYNIKPSVGMVTNLNAVCYQVFGDGSIPT